MRFAITVIALWAMFVCVSPAYAYVDPGAGSMMVQLLLGGVAGIVVLIRLSWHRVLQALNLRKEDDRRAE
jgi:hypothetical protein